MTTVKSQLAVIFFIIEGSEVSLDESGRIFFSHNLKKKLKNDPVLNNFTIYSKMNAIFKLESSK
jgi:DNA-binding transcriptional regulator/RsmH inhibitor MraZ